MAIKPRKIYQPFADGSKYPKPPPKNTEAIIEMTVKTCWPFEHADLSTVSMEVCSGSFPESHKKNDIDHGAWYECEVEIDYSQSHAFSIESLQNIRNKVLDLTGFRLEGISFQTRKEGAYGDKVVAQLTFADWKGLVYHK